MYTIKIFFENGTSFTFEHIHTVKYRAYVSKNSEYSVFTISGEEIFSNFWEFDRYYQFLADTEVHSCFMSLKDKMSIIKE